MQSAGLQPGFLLHSSTRLLLLTFQPLPVERHLPAAPPQPLAEAPGAGVGGGAGSGAVQPNTGVFIFEHKAQHISRFIHNSHDLTYFAYLIKAQPDDPESQMACHVFRATDPNQVSCGCQGAGLGPPGLARQGPLF